ncbi:MAG: class I SAM-dependent methyltransferase [Phycisphaeraceae bacterium]|nr:class I SAM-dependent methyltransferase [Phycisphaeraceae bacterium]
MPNDSTKRFSDRVDAYVRYRPGYPARAVDWLLERSGLSAPGVIADIGSGTGIATEPLLQRGHRVYAVEPNQPMRERAEQTLCTFEGFQSVDGTAESTTLEDRSVDLITAAQAFHWFKHDATRAEFARILKPGKGVALLWNDRVTTGDAFLAGYESLLKAHATDYERINHQNLDEADFEGFFDGDYAFESFDNAQRLDLAGLVGRVESSSYMPGPGHARHAAMIDALRALFDRHAVDHLVTIAYKTTVRIGRVA